MNAFRDRILIATPNNQLFSELSKHLQRDFEIQQATSPQMALFLSGEWNAQICIIDGDSVFLDLIQPLREKYSFSQLGVVVLTREVGPLLEDRAFRSGCDHTIAWKGDERPLMLRLHALSRRLTSMTPREMSPLVAADLVSFGEIQIFPNDFVIKRGRTVISMSPTQFRLLLVFMLHREQLLSRQWIKEHVWDRADISTRSIDAQVSKLKKVLPELEHALLNIYGKGYILTESRRQAA